MAKELIISANVHEKKVAIIEDGVVTEFYVERGDENQGVVGNLYKGRVMKVLPGMQSAFVDIALERDAFLYVSDFAELMEEEDILDFREGGGESRGDQRQQQQQQQGNRNRRDDRRESDFQRRRQFDRGGQNPQIAEAVVEPVVPEQVTEPAFGAQPREDVMLEDVVEQLAELVDESVIAEPQREDELEEIMQMEPPPELQEEVAAEPPPDLEATAPPDEEAIALVEDTIEEIEEEPPLRKRGRRAVKKPAKAAAEAAPKRGTRRRSAASLETAKAAEGEGEESGSPFERVSDDLDAESAGDLLKDAIVQEKIIDRVHTDEYRLVIGEEDQPVARVGSLRSKLAADSRFQRVRDEEEATRLRNEREAAERAAEEQAAQQSQSEAFGEERAASDAAFRTNQADDSPEEVIIVESSTEKETQEPEELVDAEAEVRDRGFHAEFAIRRGGRGRRRRRDQAPQVQEEEQPREAAPEGESEESATEEAEAQEERIVVEQRPRVQEQPQRRPDRPERPERQEYGGGGRQNQQNRRMDRVNPTISELLREGQEILVQIAKEPIAKKGARITSHIALPGRYLVYMPTVNHVGVSRKIGSDMERVRLKRTVSGLRDREAAAGGFIVRTACEGHTEQELQEDMRYLLRTWADIKKKAERCKSPSLVHRDLDLVQRILRDHLSDEFSAIRVDNEVEYARLVEFVNRIQPKLVKRVKLYTGEQPILEKYGVQQEVDKALKPRVWLKSGGYIVINQTEALVAIDVNTGKFVGKSDRLEDTITRTNLEAVKEIVRQVRLRDLGGIIVIDFIDMEERKNRQKVMAALQQELQADRAPSKILSINDFGLVAITRKRVKQSLERTLCSPCPYCQGAGLAKSAQTMCFEILEQAKAISKQTNRSNDVTLRVSPEVAEELRAREKDVLEEIEAYFSGPVAIESDPNLHREQFDFAIV